MKDTYSTKKKINFMEKIRGKKLIHIYNYEYSYQHILQVLSLKQSEKNPNMNTFWDSN